MNVKARGNLYLLLCGCSRDCYLSRSMLLPICFLVNFHFPSGSFRTARTSSSTVKAESYVYKLSCLPYRQVHPSPLVVNLNVRVDAEHIQSRICKQRLAFCRLMNVLYCDRIPARTTSGCTWLNCEVPCPTGPSSHPCSSVDSRKGRKAITSFVCH